MNRYRALLIDMDGTIYLKGQLIDGAITLLRELKEKGMEIRYVTNTTSIRLSQIAERLHNYGNKYKFSCANPT